MKYCSKCASACDDGMAYCPRCGTPLELAPVDKKAAPANVPDFTDAPSPEASISDASNFDVSAPVPPAQPQKMNVSVLWMVLNIVATVLCCPGFLFTVTGIVFSALGSESFKKGDEAGARRNAMISMILFIVGVLVGIAGWVLFIRGVSSFSNYSGLYPVG